jgi:2-polyprenyl-6-methoxyphenol hydroxylase-like FAD-dependent oxidoreductase
VAAIETDGSGWRIAGERFDVVVGADGAWSRVRPLLRVIETGTIIGTRPLYALLIGQRWTSRPGVMLIGDAAHLLSASAGEGVNAALADAADRAEALASEGTWAAVAAHETALAARAAVASKGSAVSLRAVFSAAGVAPVLDRYRERLSIDV